MPSANSVDEVNAVTARADFFYFFLQNIREPQWPRRTFATAFENGESAPQLQKNCASAPLQKLRSRWAETPFRRQKDVKLLNTTKTMAIKIKAIEKKMTVGTHAGEYRYQMQPELYSALTQDKVIREAALRSGVSQGVMQACWDAAGEVIKAWATEGHSVALPGLGTMRFGLSAGTVSNVNDVKTGLIKTRRIVFTPNTGLKQELKDTAIQITCYDRNGDIVRRVTSTSGDVVTEPDTDSTTDSEDSGNVGTSQGGSQDSDNSTSQGGSGSSESGSGSSTTGGSTSNGGSSDSGSGSGNSGSQSDGGTSGDGGSGGGDNGYSFG